MSNEIDHDYTDDPVCPHCGEVHQDAWEWREDDGECDCGKCEKPFFYTRHISVSYSTTKLPRNPESSGEQPTPEAAAR